MTGLGSCERVALCILPVNVSECMLYRCFFGSERHGRILRRRDDQILFSRKPYFVDKNRIVDGERYMRLLVYSEVVYTCLLLFYHTSLLNHTHSHTNLHSTLHSSKSRTKTKTQAEHARPSHTPPSLTSNPLKNTNPPHPLHTQTPPSSSKRRTSRPHSLPTSEILDQILARRNISFV